MRQRAKTDRNHQEILNALRRLGWSVFSTHQLGKGFPDAVGSRKGETYLIEIKDGKKPPSKRKLTPDELEFRRTWQGKYWVIESLDDVVKLDKMV